MAVIAFAALALAGCAGLGGPSYELGDRATRTTTP